MKNFRKIDITKIKTGLINIKNKIKKVHVITFTVVVTLSVTGFFYGQYAWKKYSVSKGAKNIISKVSQSQQNIKNETGQYTNDLFQDLKLVSELSLSTDIETQGKNSQDNDSSKSRAAREDDSYRKSPFRSSQKSNMDLSDSNIGQSGDYYVEIDADNGCMIVKYRRFTTDKTTFYAFFKDANAFCQGRYCQEKTDPEEIDLCYVSGMCFPKKLDHETERPCGDGHGKQTRECKKSCDGGTCDDWGECVCNKGYGWDGETCKQLQTEKDCNRQQCFNGVYCEEPDILNKEIENGTCKRKAACEPNKGWQYSSWECNCDKVYLCPVNEQCTVMPQNTPFLELPDGEGSCKNIVNKCFKNQGWKQFATSCTCNKVGTFWDEKTGEAKCSPCTKKPENAVFTSNAKSDDSCAWECLPGFDNRNNDCTKPDGQYLCARTSLQSCTDEFSKIRKMEIDKKTNEGQLCYTDVKDNNILFFDKKTQACTICQCVISVDKKPAVNANIRQLGKPNK